MNPLTNVKNITKLNEIELAKGTKKSWHDIYKDSAWIFIGGLAYDLTEGDVLTVFSQYGEIVNINLIRDKKTGKPKGYCFLCYANQKSTVLAVDNFNGIKLCNRTIRVDHVANYKPPKEDERDDEITKKLKSEGCAPQVTLPEKKQSDDVKVKREKKKKKEKKEKKKKKKHSEAGEQTSKSPKIKEERYDPGYDKYDTHNQNKSNKPTDRGYACEGSHEVIDNITSTSVDQHRSKHDHLFYEKKRLLGSERDHHESKSADGKKSLNSEKYDFNKHYVNNRERDKGYSGGHELVSDHDERRDRRYSDMHDSKKPHISNHHRERDRGHSSRYGSEKPKDHDRKREKLHSNRHDSDRHRERKKDEQVVKKRSSSVSSENSASSSSTGSEEDQIRERQSKRLPRSYKRQNHSESVSSCEDEQRTKAKKAREESDSSRGSDMNELLKHNYNSHSKKDNHCSDRHSHE